MTTLRLGTRGSKLAAWQTEAVARALRQARPSLRLQRVIVKTAGDRLPARALDRGGFTGLFTSALEDRLRAGDIDVAVHSLKDLPTRLATGLAIGAVLKREDPCDVLLSARGGTLMTLPEGARLGTASLRRAAQIRARRPDIVIEPVRGNVETRIRQMQARRFDGIVLAFAGIKRLGLEHLVSERIDTELLLPAAGQGAIAIQYREADSSLGQLLRQVDDWQTSIETGAERSFLARLEAGCHVPAACLAVVQDRRILVRGLVASRDGSMVCRDALEAAVAEAATAGQTLAEKLLAAGAGRILQGAAGPGENACTGMTEVT